MDAETNIGFDIDGRRYPVPQVMSFTIDEAEILWDTCGHAVEDFAPDNDGEFTNERIRDLLVLMRNPRFRRALMHVAYRRGNPAASDGDIRDAIGAASNIDSYQQWIAQLEREDDQNPPSEASTSEQTGSSRSSSVDAARSSGTDSLRSSGEPAARLAATGTGG